MGRSLIDCDSPGVSLSIVPRIFLVELGWSWETWKSLGDRLGEKRKGRGRGGSSGRGGKWGAGVRLFHPLAALRSTTYDPFKGVL